MTDEVLSTTAQNQLKQYIDQIESAETEKSEISEHIKDIYTTAKGTGFDTKIIKKIVRLRKKSREARQEEEALTELYLEAIGDPT